MHVLSGMRTHDPNVWRQFMSQTARPLWSARFRYYVIFVVKIAFNKTELYLKSPDTLALRRLFAKHKETRAWTVEHMTKITFLSIPSLVNHALGNCDYGVQCRRKGQRITNRKGSERKRSWPSMRCCPRHLSGGTKAKNHGEKKPQWK
jgi:hypothetical protein